jgi:hypothetical protein
MRAFRFGLVIVLVSGLLIAELALSSVARAQSGDMLDVARIAIFFG